ncbi:ABC transporter permease subunit [Virgisporangium aurantiacum]|uniref:ABC-type transport system involved in multi-copper enzyme maturation, permease component n=1 Tax=Virgisporangium aurantiacum TaxID=175570 RepID=A0A8J3Z585_9ACTN|nr:ABC transporter permease subunit [Virgisporangium aurantiacum]GIJ56553.1 hypothetical protein Vau01_040690 [Virgisporangium aurantiacum]
MFVNLVRAEWVKLRSVRSTFICVTLAAGLMLLVSILLAANSSTDANTGPNWVSQFRFVHQPLTGDGSITARVASQQDTGPLTRAGVMIRSSTEPDSTYAALAVTPSGVRLQVDFGPDGVTRTGGGPRWLRLTRAGSTVAAAESADGVTWTTVRTVDLAALPPDAQVGLFVTSPGTKTRTVRVSAGATSSGPEIVQSTATFDNVTVTPAGPADWAALDVGPVPTQVAGGPVPGSSSRDGDTFTLTGAGNIGTLPPGGDDDIVRNSLVGTTMALIVVVVLGALVVTSEYSKGLIRTTFTVSPRRRAVLVAKGLVLTAVVFVLGSVTSFAALVFTRPTQRENGYVAPAYPDPSLTDGPVLRAVLGTGLLLAVFALIAMGVGVLVRRASVAITLVLALIIVPGVVNPFLSIEAELWVNRLTPMAGMAIQQTRERFDNPMDPWPGFGVLCAYAAVVLLLALWRLPRRDA